MPGTDAFALEKDRKTLVTTEHVHHVQTQLLLLLLLFCAEKGGPSRRFSESRQMGNN